MQRRRETREAAAEQQWLGSHIDQQDRGWVETRTTTTARHCQDNHGDDGTAQKSKMRSKMDRKNKFIPARGYR